jgi:hypothetical protein
MARKDFRIVRDTFANDNGLPFGRLLAREYVLSVLESEGHEYRQRVFCPLVTLWAWLSQSLSQDKSLNECVTRILAHRVSTGLPICSASSAAYSKARSRFPLPVMSRIAREIGRTVHDSAPEGWNWNGRQVFLADGTGFSMSDTPENQFAYPQIKTVKQGLGFPTMRAVALISLATGAVVDMAYAPHEGKGTGESNLLRRLLHNLSDGDVLVADRYYPSYLTLALMQQRGVDMVSVSHSARKVDFSQGEQRGERDHVVEWQKPAKRPTWMSVDEYAALPRSIRVREFLLDVAGRDGRTEKAIVVSTITDPDVPQKELSDLYWRRWNCELDLRAIKHSLHADVLRCKTPDMVEKELWCHVLAYNLLRGVMTESAIRKGIMPRQLSVKRTMQAVESFTPAMMASQGNEALYDAFLMTVSSSRVGNRPGRQEPRLKKRRPVWRELMMKPRDSYHRRLASEGRALS